MNVLPKEKIVLEEDVDALEIRVHIDSTADFLIEGYSFRPIISVQEIKKIR